MKQSIVMALAFATAFSLPAAAQINGNAAPQAPQQAPQQQAPQQQAPQQQAPRGPRTPNANEFIVDQANMLAKAIDDAEAKINAGTITSATIWVTTTQPQQLPASIKANGKITIIGNGNRPAGLGAEAPDAPRTPLTPHPHGPVDILSPVEIRGVTVTGFTHTLFQPHQAFAIVNSTFTGGNNPKTTPYVVTTDLHADHVDDQITIEDNAFTNTHIANIEDGEGTVSIQRNHLKTSIRRNEHPISIAQSPKYVVGRFSPVVIRHNHFEAQSSDDLSSVVRIARPDVKVEQNAFVLTQPKPQAFAVLVVSNQVEPTRFIMITRNSFTGGIAVGNHIGAPLQANALTLQGNDFSKAAHVLPIGDMPHKDVKTVTPKANTLAPKNFWGPLPNNTVAATITENLDAFDPIVAPVPPKGDGIQPPTRPTPPQVQTPNPPTGPGGRPAPSAPPTTNPSAKRTVIRIAGPSRVETAIQAAQHDYPKGAPTVVIARADVAADSIAAVPLGEELNAPVLLTQPDRLHPATAAELQRLLPKGAKVIVMGGDAAINPQVSQAISHLGFKVERIAGANRAGTAVAVAEQLKAHNKLTQVLVADGADWQPVLIAGPAAAEVNGVTLLSNGTTPAPETTAFLQRNAGLKVTAIGATAATATKAATAITGNSPTTLSVNVAKAFFPKPTTIGVATTADFADALAGGVQIAKKDGPMLLLPGQVDAATRTYLNATPSITHVYVYGGEARFNQAALDALAE